MEVAELTQHLGSLQGDSFRALLPEDIRGKGYAKEINDFSGLLKMLDGAQSKLGERVFPGEDSPREAWENVYKKLGRPDDPNAYNIGDLKGAEILKPIFHKIGLNARQAAELAKELSGIDAQDSKAAQESFNKAMIDIFGVERDIKEKGAREFLMSKASDRVKPLVEAMDEKGLAALLGIVSDITKDTGKEDYVPGNGGGADTQRASVINTRLKELYKKTMSDAQVPLAEQRQAQTEISTLIAELAEIEKKLTNVRK